ncbi:hypothetical protein [Lacrimispora xylanisolvens]|uniref:hypothetical protein n=1 Tax=Lacrimispora xylanisolvens TaxID=384636 RepID=UPI002402960B
MANYLLRLRQGLKRRALRGSYIQVPGKVRADDRYLVCFFIGLIAGTIIANFWYSSFENEAVYYLGLLNRSKSVNGQNGIGLFGEVLRQRLIQICCMAHRNDCVCRRFILFYDSRTWIFHGICHVCHYRTKRINGATVFFHDSDAPMALLSVAVDSFIVLGRSERETVSGCRTIFHSSFVHHGKCSGNLDESCFPEICPVKWGFMKKNIIK